MMKPHFICLLPLLISTCFFLCSNCQQKSETQILLEVKATWDNPPALISKNLEINFHFVRERVANKTLQNRFLSTRDQIAHALTKTLAVPRFLFLHTKLKVNLSASACRGANDISQECSSNSTEDAQQTGADPVHKVYFSRPERTLPGCSIAPSSSNKLSRKLITIFATLGFAVLVGTGVVGILLLRAQIKRKTTGYDETQTAWKLTSFHKFDFTEDQITQGLKEENIIGSGGSGKVYKIILNNDEDQIVAVKRIFVGHVKMDSNLEKNFNAEVSILGQIRHANIVKLLCCISSPDSKLLVYEYMENSSLDRWLSGKERMDGTRSLHWPTRLRIAIDSAKGLCYMHHSYSRPIMHRDIKSSNILLDMKFRAKVADFGLARVLEKSGEPETVSNIQGSFGYIAPECGRKRKINEKVDVYSFGVILLELTTGKRANEGDEYEALADWALRLYLEHGMLVDMIDEGIRNDDEYLPDIAAVFELGLSCTLKDPIARPTMKMVV